MNHTIPEGNHVDWIKANLDTQSEWTLEDYRDFYHRDIAVLLPLVERLTKLASEAIGGPVKDFELLLSSERLARIERSRAMGAVNRQLRIIQTLRKELRDIKQYRQRMAKTATNKRPRIDTNATVNRLAYRLAKDLMTSGGGGEIMSDRLAQITKDGRDLGGWGFNPLVKRIAAHLRGEL